MEQEQLLQEYLALLKENQAYQHGCEQENSKQALLSSRTSSLEQQQQEIDNKLQHAEKQKSNLLTEQSEKQSEAEMLEQELQEFKTNHLLTYSSSPVPSSLWGWKRKTIKRDVPSDIKDVKDEISLKKREKEILLLQIYELQKEHKESQKAYVETVKKLSAELTAHDSALMTAVERRMQEKQDVERKVAHANFAVIRLQEKVNVVKGECDALEETLERKTSDFQEKVGYYKSKLYTMYGYHPDSAPHRNMANLLSQSKQMKEQEHSLRIQIVDYFRAFALSYDRYHSTWSDYFRSRNSTNLPDQHGLMFETFAEICSVIQIHMGALPQLADAVVVLEATSRGGRDIYEEQSYLGFDMSEHGIIQHTLESLSKFISTFGKLTSTFIIWIQKDSRRGDAAKAEIRINDSLIQSFQKLSATIPKVLRHVEGLLLGKEREDAARHILGCILSIDAILREHVEDVSAKLKFPLPSTTDGENETPYSKRKEELNGHLQELQSLFGGFYSHCKALYDLYFTSNQQYSRGHEVSIVPMSPLQKQFLEKATLFHRRMRNKKDLQSIPFHRVASDYKDMKNLQQIICSKDEELLSIDQMMSKLASQLHETQLQICKIQRRLQDLSSQAAHLNSSLSILHERGGDSRERSTSSVFTSSDFGDWVSFRNQLSGRESTYQETASVRQGRAPNTQTRNSNSDLLDDIAIYRLQPSAVNLTMEYLDFQSHLEEEEVRFLQFTIETHKNMAEGALSQLQIIEQNHFDIMLLAQEGLTGRLKLESDGSEQQPLHELQAILVSEKKDFESEIKAMSLQTVENSQILLHLQNMLADLRSYQILCSKCQSWNTVGWLDSIESKGGKCHMCFEKIARVPKAEML